MKAAIPDLAMMNRLAVSAPAFAPKAAAPDQAADTARQFEALFVEQMLKTMRESSIGDDAMFPGQAGLFREMHDREVVKSASSGQGFGLAPMIERSLRMQQSALEGDLQPLALPSAPGKSFPLDGYARLLPAQRLERAASAADASGAVTPALHGKHAAAPLAPTAPEPAPRSVETQAEPPRSSETRAAAAAAASDRVSSATPKSTPEQFIERVWPHAQRAAAALGVDPRMLVAQAALETGWGKHVPRAADGGAGNNLFGIKAGRSWQGERANHLTQEFRDGRLQPERADFRSYDSVASSFQDYVELVRGNQRYAPALAAAGNNHAYASALQRAGYATDPQYAAKLTSIAHGPRLNRAIAALGPDPAAPGAAGSLLAQNLQAKPDIDAARG